MDTANPSIDVYVLHDGRYDLKNVYSIFTDWEIDGMTEDEKKAVNYTFTPSQFPDMIVDLEQVFVNMI